ncbi:MAG: trypsin-like serine protease [Chloroflexi bacterium]|nr:trypsin-like serine protease [Chloroflexota bacterium]
MRIISLIAVCMVLCACNFTVEREFYSFGDRDAMTPIALTPPTRTPERITRTPWPTQQPVATQALTDLAVISAIERHTMQLYSQSEPAVVAIEAAFSHPPVDGVDVPTEMFVSQGSGFVYDDQGHIVTNAHVVNNDTTYRIRIDEQRVISATVIGRDRTNDLAVLRLEEYVDIAPLTLRQQPVQPGMWIMAIGNPFGLRDSASVGIVSGIARDLPHEFGIMRDIIQVDAAVNPGSSGGVILDSTGAVLGLITAMQSGNGNFSGIGYAIPVRTIEAVVPTLISIP